ncbi:MAG: carboxylating nicotinate-nucleotide diphosphorylase [Gammaproteobacteria bacterium]|nr:MAG: carboxylating nicotinate-nucleotide diphosphorylase [Gammaproteobacteria bacterium]RKZ98084.1 MAG: carboxylating nicotinate-nucleotide diphosphorylase [Gammaproteobacteria bacterium]
MTIKNTVPAQLITSQVKLALQEDIGQQDLTAELIPINSQATATLITREPATLCGKDWFNEVFLQLDPSITIDWNFTDGDRLSAESIICTLTGSARTLLTGERTAMNYIQTLSATATLVQLYTDQIRDLPVQILDTRKTIPGFRLAQKYAVRCGGGYNHRVGLFDGILIKENHISATGSIDAAVNKAQQLHPNIAIEVEVETLNELEQALSAQADIILLDNFDIPTLKQAVKINKGQAKLEASGGITIESIRPIAKTGIDRISIGALTKDIRAIDLSMRFS